MHKKLQHNYFTMNEVTAHTRYRLGRRHAFAGNPRRIDLVEATIYLN